MKNTPVLCAALVFNFICIAGLGAQQAEYTSGMFRDPFKKQLPLKASPLIDKSIRPKGKSKKEITPPKIAVNGIVSGGETPLAVISGKILGLGDSIENSVITEINKDGIKVLYESEEFSYPAPSKSLKIKMEEKDAN